MIKSQFLLALSLTSAVSVSASPYAKYPTLAEVKKTFYSEGVVPDVLPSFNPTSFIYLTFTGDLSDGTSSKVVLPNTSFVRNDTLIPPEISVQGLKGGPYVVAIVDPDAPSRATPTVSQIRHLLAANFTVSNTRSKYVPQSFVLKNSTAAVNDYRPPTPPVGSGPHRYVALLYSQPKNFDVSFLNVSDIRLFNISSFAARTGLGEPLAGTFLTVEQKNTTVA
ncbi:OV-16 antigen OS=Onchocerca volvulus GN=OV16 PE=2 SV=2 [Rhizoctonia solani AG-1 IB]|uniref:OV-16 antigen n=1 Tax=Thanatephorus cucumeris (strain AG1-IB / isolate 7/3/14) TaxID=1108050 RepID=M5C818_THACB|nr:OV-16 antigen [Rhizoctonia solani AG-1 IB]CEL60408.1 OV-16 antigen OS=Onchocerca volvulus GN=OV16 PE=2 SV=2 [Rhizoctonia solani AG-1 IB]